MNIDKNFIILDNYNVSALQKFFAGSNEDVWFKNTLRQDRHTVLKETQAIILKFIDPKDEDNTIVTYPEYVLFLPLISDILQKINTYYKFPNGKFRRIMFARMPPNTEIFEHIDNGAIFHAHRIHLVIKTNEDVDFRVDGERIPVNTEGTLIEINNKRLHKVVNNGSADRIHMIMDYVASRTKEEL